MTAPAHDMSAHHRPSAVLLVEAEPMLRLTLTKFLRSSGCEVTACPDLRSGAAALASGFFELAPVGRIRIKGVRQPVQTFALVKVGAARTRLEASRARGFSHFVGRADEVAVLEGALSRAISGFGRVVGVAGAPGVGKSRLCQEVIDR